jgi:putative transposase
MARLPASEQTRQRLKELIQGGGDVGGKSDLVRMAARLIIEEALEAEVDEVLGRKHYEHGKAENGYRNGYRSGRLKSAEGEIVYSVPQVTGREEPYASRIRGNLAGRSEELEDLAVEMYARGLSTRDIEKAFRASDGKPLLSKSAVSIVTERLWEDYKAFASRDLSEFNVAYFFMDGIAERLHLGQPREAVLAAWGILEDGKKVLLHLAPGTKEDTASVRDFIRDMKNRGLVDPVLACTDGAPGVIRAVEECFPRSLRQRCLAHKIRNILGKAPDHEWREMKALAHAAYHAASPKLAEMAREEFASTYQDEHPTAVACFLDDFEACVAHLRLPITHRKATRTTNMLERLFGEERRRTKIIPHAFGERAVLKLMYAALARASESWRNVKTTEFERRQIGLLRKELNEGFETRHQAPVVKVATPPARISSKGKT